MNDKTLNSVIKDLQENLNKLTDEHLKVLDDFKETQVIGRFLLQHEERRLNKKLGKDHPRTRRLKAILEHNLDVIKDLEVESEIARIKIPEVSERDTLIHGRVTDENYRGIGGLIVSMADDTGKTLTALGRPETDDSGYYAFVIHPDTFEEMSGILKERVFLNVHTRKCRVIHHTCEPLKISEGDRKLVEIALTREDLFTPEKPEEPPTTEEEREKEVDVKLEDISGIGQGRAKLLRNAGITGVKAFVEAGEARLKEILGNINVRELQKKGASLLEKMKKTTHKKEKE